MKDAGEDRSTLAVALQWAYRVTAICFEMVVPGVIGLWCDNLLGTRFLFGICGFVLGMVLGVWHLIRISGQVTPKSAARTRSKHGGADSGETIDH